MTTEVERIAEIRARNEKRTQGEWIEAHDRQMTKTFIETKERLPAQFSNLPRAVIALMCPYDNAKDAAFIAAAPDDIAFLLAQLEHKNALIERTGRILAATLFELESLQSEVDQLLAVVKAQEGEL